MTLREYRRGPVPIQVRGYADIRVVSYLYRHESRCFLEQYIHLHIADPFYGTPATLLQVTANFKGRIIPNGDA